MPGIVAHDSNSSTRRKRQSDFASPRPAWSTYGIPDKPGLYGKTLTQKLKKIIKELVSRTGELPQSVNYLPYKQEELSSVFRSDVEKQGIAAQVCNFSAGGAETLNTGGLMGQASRISEPRPIRDLVSKTQCG